VSTSVMCDDRKGFTSNDNLRPRDFFQVFSTLYALTNNLFYDSNKLKSQGEMSKLAKEDDVNSSIARDAKLFSLRQKCDWVQNIKISFYGKSTTKELKIRCC
jgi:hypothetical protein